jgi:hypothetical protein
MAEGPADGRKTVTYRYTFTFQDGASRTFDVRLDAETLDLVQHENPSPPDWTRLEHCQCPGCPLTPDRHPRCPPAARLVDVIEFFKNLNSFDTADVRVEGPNRAYAKRAQLQHAASALIGLHMVASGCPILNKLRPMADTHLPFSTTAETTYRLLSMYLLSQHYRAQRGETPDWDLARLRILLEQLQQVDTAFCRRLQSIPMKDANLNAMVILNNFSMAAGMALDGFMMEHMERLFREHGP